DAGGIHLGGNRILLDHRNRRQPGKLRRVRLFRFLDRIAKPGVELVRIALISAGLQDKRCAAGDLTSVCRIGCGGLPEPWGVAMSFLAELWSFMRVRKKFWLLPILTMLVLLGGLIGLTKGSAGR